MMLAKELHLAAARSELNLKNIPQAHEKGPSIRFVKLLGEQGTGRGAPLHGVGFCDKRGQCCRWRLPRIRDGAGEKAPQGSPGGGGGPEHDVAGAG